ncbi:hypothetical protein [Silvimonas amylolytica]|uniref:hypothetical protein n=1 Tax=Silvimonas amylolytica TaxID=449663 RepID=UPI001E42BBE2|nr:hypothetical protein [Silvimonas amylolytica]
MQPTEIKKRFYLNGVNASAAQSCGHVDEALWLAVTAQLQNPANVKESSFD